MTFEDLQITHPVEIEVSINNKQTTLISTIEHKVKQSILLSPLKYDNKIIGFPPECSISLYYIEDSKVYRWSHLAIKAVKYENEIYHSVEIPAEAEVLNRRGSFRVYIGERVPLTSFTANGPKKTTVLLKDVSESGLAFLSEEEFTVSKTVRVQLQLSEHHNISLTAQIVRTQELENRSETLYGCKFVEKSPMISKFLMSKQQERQKQKNR